MRLCGRTFPHESLRTCSRLAQLNQRTSSCRAERLSPTEVFEPGASVPLVAERLNQLEVSVAVQLRVVPPELFKV